MPPPPPLDEVKEGHPDFLQVTLFFLNAVLLLYLKLFNKNNY